VEKPTILYVLKKTDGNITKASQILGITRATLRKKIIGYNINTVRNA
jgi:Fis family transcriptional regulator